MNSNNIDTNGCGYNFRLPFANELYVLLVTVIFLERWLINLIKLK